MLFHHINDGLGDIGRNVQTKAVKLFDHGGGHRHILGTEIDIFHVRVDQLVDLGNVFLVVIVHVVAQSADHVVDAVGSGILRHKTFIDRHMRIGDPLLCQRPFHGGAHLFSGKAAPLVGIDTDDDVNLVKQSCRFLHNVQMAAGKGIKRAGIDGTFFHISTALRRRGCGHPPSADAASPGLPRCGWQTAACRRTRCPSWVWEADW